MRAREIGIAKLQSVKFTEHRIYGTTYVRYYIQRKCTADMTSVGLAQARPNYVSVDKCGILNIWSSGSHVILITADQLLCL